MSKLSIPVKMTIIICVAVVVVTLIIAAVWSGSEINLSDILQTIGGWVGGIATALGARWAMRPPEAPTSSETPPSP